MNKKVALCEDDNIVLEGLISLLETVPDIKIVGTCKDSKSLELLLQKTEIDLLITDLSMPGVNGLKLLKAVRKNYPKLLIIVLTMFTQPALVKKVMKLGIKGFLSKHATKHELIHCINMVINGREYVQKSLSSVSPVNAFQYSGDNVALSDFVDSYGLSRREMQVFLYMAKGKSTEEIAKKLDIAEETVASHRKAIYAKTGRKNIAEITLVAIKNGLLEE